MVRPMIQVLGFMLTNSYQPVQDFVHPQYHIIRYNKILHNNECVIYYSTYNMTTVFLVSIWVYRVLPSSMQLLQCIVPLSKGPWDPFVSDLPVMCFIIITMNLFFRIDPLASFSFASRKVITRGIRGLHGSTSERLIRSNMVQPYPSAIHVKSIGYV